MRWLGAEKDRGAGKKNMIKIGHPTERVYQEHIVSMSGGERMFPVFWLLIESMLVSSMKHVWTIFKQIGNVHVGSLVLTCSHSELELGKSVFHNEGKSWSAQLSRAVQAGYSDLRSDPNLWQNCTICVFLHMHTWALILSWIMNLLIHL